MSVKDITFLWVMWNIIIPVIAALVLLVIVYTLMALHAVKTGVKELAEDVQLHPGPRNEWWYDLKLRFNIKPQHWSELDQFEKDRKARRYSN